MLCPPWWPGLLLPILTAAVSDWPSSQGPGLTSDAFFCHETSSFSVLAASLCHLQPEKSFFQPDPGFGATLVQREQGAMPSPHVSSGLPAVPSWGSHAHTGEVPTHTCGVQALRCAGGCAPCASMHRGTRTWAYTWAPRVGGHACSCGTQGVRGPRALQTSAAPASGRPGLVRAALRQIPEWRGQGGAGRGEVHLKMLRRRCASLLPPSPPVPCSC